MFSVCALVVVVGCGPRGESHSLDQVFADARSSFTSVGTTGVPSDVAEALKKLAGDLDTLADKAKSDSTDAKGLAKGIGDTLDELVSRSGMTQRPSITELVNQYRAASHSGALKTGDANLRLLTARTYTLLSSELQTTKFGL